jgi:hypothetical protein
MAKIKFEMYMANWIDGNISFWDYYNQNWIRNKPNTFVFLKILNNLSSITLELINKV